MCALDSRVVKRITLYFNSIGNRPNVNITNVGCKLDWPLTSHLRFNKLNPELHSIPLYMPNHERLCIK